MTNSINLADLIGVLKKTWWKILIFTVIVALAVGLFAHFFVPRKYTSSVEFMVNNASMEFNYTTQALTAAAESLAKDYIRIISGDTMIDTIKQYISDPNRDSSGDYAKLTDSQIRGMISSTAPSDGSSMFSVAITTTEDRNLAYYIAECIALNAPDTITNLVWPSKTSDIQNKAVYVIRKPILAAGPSSPNIKNYVLISAVLTAVASYALFVAIKMFDNVISTEDDLQEKLNKTVIGNIPEWSLDSSARKKENN